MVAPLAILEQAVAELAILEQALAELAFATIGVNDSSIWLPTIKLVTIKIVN